METGYEVKIESEDNELHLLLCGEFGSEAAWDVFNLLALRDTGGKKIFIHTENLESVAPMGRAVFRNLLKLSMMPVDRMRFKGAQSRFLV